MVSTRFEAASFFIVVPFHLRKSAVTEDRIEEVYELSISKLRQTSHVAPGLTTHRTGGRLWRLGFCEAMNPDTLTDSTFTLTASVSLFTAMGLPVYSAPNVQLPNRQQPFWSRTITTSRVR